MAVFDQDFNVLPGAIETLNQENAVQIAKVAWLSRKFNPKSYGSMVVYLTKSTDAKRLLQEYYFLVAGESAYTSVFEQITGPEQCYKAKARSQGILVQKDSSMWKMRRRGPPSQ
ncbi:hypothetical protein FocnCong_v009748 [Fusarium oxysporum f. sp. conglutinans]|nr:hypothetical protein FocnCong_v009748 [Fusarium oxysporum f. sp. conglutinans]